MAVKDARRVAPRKPRRTATRRARPHLSPAPGMLFGMTRYIALLRGINVGGRTIKSAELSEVFRSLGYDAVKTVLASGNVVFQSPKTEAQVKAALQAALSAYAGKPVGVMVRTAAEMAAVLAHNPFSKMPGNRTVAYFLDGKPSADVLETVTNQTSEQLRLGVREIYGYYPDGQGDSKLKIPAAKNGTARNMNTIATLVDWATE